MPTLTVDGIAVSVPEGSTIMAAARAAGIEIPALCHVPGIHPLTSCMVCVVMDTNRGRLLPSCSAPAEDGMSIDSTCPEVVEARRDVLEMLLSEHVGDCEAPCRQICPASLNVSGMMARIALGDLEGAARIARDCLTLPATLGYVCSAPCQRGCHRAVKDSPLQIRELHRRAALDSLHGLAPETAAPTGKNIAIVGASAAGLAAAYVLLKRGHACILYDKAPVAGRIIREEAGESLDPEVLDAEIATIRRMGGQFVLNREIGRDLAPGSLRRENDALIIACDGLTSDGDGVFYAVEYLMSVHAVAEGKAAAGQTLRYLEGSLAHRDAPRFNSQLGALRSAELDAFLTRTDPVHDTKRTLISTLLNAVLGGPSPHTGAKHTAPAVDDLLREASRCMHCECHKPVSCRLRQYATRYDARQTAYRLAARANVEPVSRSGRVVYEPGKCIKCGLCVDVCRQSDQQAGMAFEGRGYTVRVKPPFKLQLEDALAADADRCVAICPTGALAYQDGEVQIA